MCRFALACLVPALIWAQQLADPNFHPPIPQPAYAAGGGPLILLDEAHLNFHTLAGRYAAFAGLLLRDGYRVEANREPVSQSSLSAARVLVIANPLHPSNEGNWRLPTPSAFTPAEIHAVSEWVAQGGSLFLIADHMPFAGAASDLAAAFGVQFANGFVRSPQNRTPDLFEPRPHEATQGIPTLATFTGSCFLTKKPHEPLLVLGAGFVSLEPEQAWVFHPDTPRRDVAGWLQGAVLGHGAGRVAVFGEAAMFTAQLAGPARNPMGMNHPQAAHNARFLLQLVRWLAPPPTGSRR
jgi:hypothetical protein